MHIPYCRSKCPYCDFFSSADTAQAHRYVQALHAHLEQFAADNDCKADTLYIGGGTPSVLPGQSIAALVQCFQKTLGTTAAEITVECNPSDVDEVWLQTVFDAGANRISMGMQSAVEHERRALGRRAGAKQVQQAVHMARRAGFENISLDVMLGIPGQTPTSLEQSIAACADWGVEHVSAYLLKLEEGTWFFRHADTLNLPDEDACADLYLHACALLEKAGFMQYEISNFARPGRESRHNLKYWRLEPYLGIGAAAHSFFGGRRFYYPRDVQYFIGGGKPIDDGEGGCKQEQIMLGLRLKEGISLTLLSEKAKKELDFLRQQGLIEVSSERVCCTPQGFLVSNSIIHLLTQ